MNKLVTSLFLYQTLRKLLIIKKKRILYTVYSIKIYFENILFCISQLKLSMLVTFAAQNKVSLKILIYRLQSMQIHCGLKSHHLLDPDAF